MQKQKVGISEEKVGVIFSNMINSTLLQQNDGYTISMK